MRSKLLVLGFLSIIIFANLQILFQERVRSTGRRVVLALAPVDPRSLMQGDYMTLRYAIAEDAPGNDSGVLHLQLEKNDLVRKIVTEGDSDDVKLQYHRVDGRVLFGIETFMFQEGRGADYARAKYAELRVSTEGRATLLKLLDSEFKPIGPG